MKKEIELVNNELEWLEPKPNVDPEAAVRIERLKKTFTRTVCVYCNKTLTREDRVEDGFSISIYIYQF